MPDNFKKDDLRIIKTHKALMDAMSQVLELRNFNRITVHDLCEVAQISRATFYAHFADKYDLLRYWLNDTRSALLEQASSYDDIEQHVNTFAAERCRTVRNLLEDANPETAELLCDFIISLWETPTAKSAPALAEARQTVLNKFCAGGVYNYLQWMVKHKCPAGLPPLNRNLYNIIKALCQTGPE